MTYAEFNAVCAGFVGATHVEQWGGAQVWKVGGRVFAIGGWGQGAAAFTFKVSEIGFAMLRDRPGLRPAPYLASRGLLWIQRVDDRAMDDAELCDYLLTSHAMVAAKLSAKLRRAIGLEAG